MLGMRVFTARDLMRETGLSEPAVYNCLKTLRESGLIYRERRAKDGRRSAAVWRLRRV